MALRTAHKGGCMLLGMLKVLGCAFATDEADVEAPVTVVTELSDIGAYEGYDAEGELMAGGQNGTVTVTNSGDQPLTVTIDIKDTSNDAESPDAPGMWNVTAPERTIAPGESMTTDIWYRFLDGNPPGEGTSTETKTGILSIKAVDDSGSTVFEDEIELRADVTDVNPPD